MNPATQVILSGCLSFGIPLLIALYELRSLRRYRPGGRDWRRLAPRPRPSRPNQGGTRPLPACLVPNATWHGPAPVRLREPA